MYLDISSLTEKSRILKESVLKVHESWTMSSKMPQTYIHYLGNESVYSLLEAKGWVIKEKEKDNNIRSKIALIVIEPKTTNAQFRANPN